MCLSVLDVVEEYRLTRFSRQQKFTSNFFLSYDLLFFLLFVSIGHCNFHAFLKNNYKYVTVHPRWSSHVSQYERLDYKCQAYRTQI